MKKPSVAFALSWLLIFLILGPGYAQTKEEGQALYNEALGLQNLAQTSEDLKKAVEKYEQALAIFQQLEYLEGIAATANNLGIVYAAWGQYDKAVEYFEKSLAISRRLNDPAGEANNLLGLGKVHASWGQHGTAVEIFQTSLNIKRALEDKSGEADTLSCMGIAYAQLGRFYEALNYLEESNAIKAEIGVPTSGGKDWIGNVYLDMDNVDKAEPLIVESGYDASLGRLSLLKGDYSKAAEYYQKALSDAEKNRDAENLFASYTGLGLAYENLDDYKTAEENYRKAVDLTEEVRSSLNRDQREKFFDVKVHGFLRTAPYDGLARVLSAMGKTEEALKVSEYTKARIFAESMSKRSDKSNFDINAEVKKQDEDINNQLSALKKTRQEAYSKGNKPVIEAIEPQVKELEAKLQAHIKMLREKYPLFAAIKYPQPMDLHQAALKENEWVLVYHVTDPGIIIYLIRGTELVKALFKPISRENLDNLVLAFRKPLEVIPAKGSFYEQLKSFDFVAGKKLSDLLLSDVLESLPLQVPLVIIPYDSLGMLPFEALVMNDTGSIKTDKDLPYVSGAEFFGDRNPISYYESITTLALARRQARPQSVASRLIVIADPVYGENDQRALKAPKKKSRPGTSPLPFMRLMGAEESSQVAGLRFQRLSLTGELAKALAALYEEDCAVYTGYDASKSNFLKNIAPHIRQDDKIVFGTHCYFGNGIPGLMEPALVLTLVPPGTDGYLRMTEVMDLDMKADIVVLMGSATGLGERISVEGNMGMGRAFRYAGANSVLMSLWSVSEVTSVKLIKSFFLHLEDGKSKLKALELARSELRKGVWNHPFFWAGFILVGETN